MLRISDNDIYISPSIIATDLCTLGGLLPGMDPSAVDLLHMDVMDGRFVPNLTFGPGYIRDIRKHTSIPLDVHLMIEKPEDSLQAYMDLEPWCITIHYESTRFPARILESIRGAGIKAGLSLNPATPVEAVFDLCSGCDIILVMSVDPGFYGQKFMPAALGRIKRLDEYLGKLPGGHGPAIQVDGGITGETIVDAVRAGGRIFVAGNAAFSGGDVNENVRELKNRGRAALSQVRNI
jgi:ribulose-phosphate 3-epimerase